MIMSISSHRCKASFFVTRNNFGDLCVCFYKMGIKAASLIYFLTNDLMKYINLFTVNPILLVTNVNFGEISLVLVLVIIRD